MAQTTRQTNLLVQQDWTKVYQSFTNADFTSYDFETLRNSMINYLKNYYPETFNDFLESSEYLALIDMIAFLGQSLSFRTDLNARENFIDTAQRRDSILKLARMLSYNPTRTTSATGLLKIDSVSTTESITDSSGINLSNYTVHWNDITNSNWLEQFTTVINASLVTSQAIGKPGNSQIINGIQTDEYTIALDPNTLPVAGFNIAIQNVQTRFEAVSATTLGKPYIYESDPTNLGRFNILYQNDSNGNGSNNTGFFLYFKQGSLQASNFNIQNAIPNNYVPINTNNINNTDAWLYSLNANNSVQTLWQAVPALPGINIIYNQLTNKNLYQINTRTNDQINLIFGDGAFANIPHGSYRFYYRTTNGLSYSVTPDDLASVTVAISYVSIKGTLETLTFTASLKYTVTNATASQSLTSIKTYAPQQYYTQNRMITGEDYNIFPLTQYTSIQKIKAINRTSSGVSLYLDTLDPTGSFSTTNIFCDDGNLRVTGNGITSYDGVASVPYSTTNDVYTAIYDKIIPEVSSTGMSNYYYAHVTRYTPPQTTIKYFNTDNTLKYNGTIQSLAAAGSGNLQYVDVGSSIKFTNPDSTITYATVTRVDSNATVYFGGTVANAAVVSTIIPPFKNDFDTGLISTISSQIQAKVNFGLTYDPTVQLSSGRRGSWTNITPTNLSSALSSLNPLACLMHFTYTGGIYSINYRKQNYVFASGGETKFYYDPTTKVYDSATGENVQDSIKVLKLNSLSRDVVWEIYNSNIDTNGYIDNSQVLVRSSQKQFLGVPDYPNIYSEVAGTQSYRNGLYFQYKHNSPSRNRIDPTPVNIIDLYILTADYATQYINWLQDLTGTFAEPTAPTSSSLEVSYSNIDNYKAISDTLVYNPAKFKPLFGAKADVSLRVRFKVVINPAVTITANEVKSQVISAINAYFNVSNWDFGETFYFSELASYLHATLVPNIASVIIVPEDPNIIFGNYFQINAEPWEIITSAATVDNIDIISAITAAQLNLNIPLI